MDGHSRNGGHGIPYEAQFEDWTPTEFDPNEPVLTDEELMRNIAQESFLERFGKQ